jgi:hypothetical protein
MDTLGDELEVELLWVAQPASSSESAMPDASVPRNNRPDASDRFFMVRS